MGSRVKPHRYFLMGNLFDILCFGFVETFKLNSPASQSELGSEHASAKSVPYLAAYLHLVGFLEFVEAKTPPTVCAVAAFPYRHPTFRSMFRAATATRMHRKPYLDDCKYIHVRREICWIFGKTVDVLEWGTADRWASIQLDFNHSSTSNVSPSRLAVG